MILRRIVLFIIIFLGMGINNSFSQGQMVLNLNQSIKIALQHNRTLAASKEKLGVAIAKLGEAKTGFLPKLQGTANYTKLDVAPFMPGKVFANAMPSISGMPQMNLPKRITVGRDEIVGIGLQLRQPLFTGFSILNGFRMAKDGVKATEAEYSKNKDDVGSLDEQYYRNLDDSLLVVSPKDNLVFGTDIRLSLMNQRLVVGTEAALSLFNDNIIDGAISSDDSLDYDLPFDPQDFENIFVINESMIPFKPGMASIALKSYLRLFFYRNLLNISFTNIGSSFNSISTNYLQKDAMIISFNDNLMLMNNRLALNFGFNLASDNVDDTKDNTSTSTAIFTQAMYKPNDEMYFNLNFNTSGSEDGFIPDSTDFENTAIDIRSTSVSFGTGYLVKQISNAPTRFSLNFSNSLNKDNANDSFEYKRNNITLSAKTAFEHLPIKTLYSYTFTLNDNSTLVDSLNVLEKSNYNSIFLRGEFDLMEGQLKPYLDFRYNFFAGDINSQAAQMFNIGTGYEITPNSFISVDAGLKMYQNSDEPDSDYSRLNFKMKISQKF